MTVPRARRAANPRPLLSGLPGARTRPRRTARTRVSLLNSLSSRLPLSLCRFRRSTFFCYFSLLLALLLPPIPFPPFFRAALATLPVPVTSLASHHLARLRSTHPTSRCNSFRFCPLTTLLYSAGPSYSSAPSPTAATVTLVIEGRAEITMVTDNCLTPS